MFKHTLPSFIRLMVPQVMWKVKTNDRVVYLTFDDGPHPTITPWVLQQLSLYNAKATFFCIGQNVIKYSRAYNDLLAQKHAVGNHTDNHLSGWNTKTSIYIKDVEQCAAVVGGHLFRPPYGRISPLQLAALKKQGYTVVMWDVLTCDFEADLNITKAIARCMKIISPGSIIVFHDSEKAFQQLKQLLPAMLLQLTNAGYTFNTLV